VCAVCVMEGMCVSLNEIVECMCVYAVGGVFVCWVVCMSVRVYVCVCVYVVGGMCCCVGGRNLCVYVCMCVMCNAHA